MLFMSVALEDRAPYQRGAAYEKLNDETGRADAQEPGATRSGSTRPPSKMGADVMRWLYAAQMPSQNLNFGYGPADEVKRRLLTLWNSYSFFVSYAEIEGFRADVRRPRAGPADGDVARPLAAGPRQRGSCARCRATLDGYGRRRTSPRSSRSSTTSPTGTSAAAARRFWRSGADDQDAAFATL